MLHLEKNSFSNKRQSYFFPYGHENNLAQFRSPAILPPYGETLCFWKLKSSSCRWKPARNVSDFILKLLEHIQKAYTS